MRSASSILGFIPTILIITWLVSCHANESWKEPPENQPPGSGAPGVSYEHIPDVQGVRIQDSTWGEVALAEPLPDPVWQREDDRLAVSFMAYGFLPVQTKATSTIGLLPPADIDVDLGEVFDLPNFTASGRLEFHKGKWGGFVEGSYVSVGAEHLPSSPYTRFELDEVAVDAGLMYRLPLADLNPDPYGPKLHTDLIAGGRWHRLDQELTLNAGGSAAGQTAGGVKNWGEPFVGARLTVPFARRWTTTIQGDAGGFGVGSRLTWKVMGQVGWRVARRTPIELILGYRVYEVDYRSGSGQSTFNYDGMQHGPYVGVGGRF